GRPRRPVGPPRPTRDATGPLRPPASSGEPLPGQASCRAVIPADQGRMTTAPARNDVLAFEDHAGSLGPLVDALVLESLRVDVARDLAAFRAAYVAAGGHALAILAGGIPDAIAAQAARGVIAVDPAVRV